MFLVMTCLMLVYFLSISSLKTLRMLIKFLQSSKKKLMILLKMALMQKNSIVQLSALKLII